MCVPADKELAELLASVGVPLVPGRPVRPMVTGTIPPRAMAACDLRAELMT